MCIIYVAPSSNVSIISGINNDWWRSREKYERDKYDESLFENFEGFFLVVVSKKYLSFTICQEWFFSVSFREKIYKLIRFKGRPKEYFIISYDAISQLIFIYVFPTRSFFWTYFYCAIFYYGFYYNENLLFINKDVIHKRRIN